MDQTPLSDSPALRRRPTRAGAPTALVQAAMRRRMAERAFEDYVREMARQWGPPAGAETRGEDTSFPRA